MINKHFYQLDYGCLGLPDLPALTGQLSALMTRPRFGVVVATCFVCYILFFYLLQHCIA